MYISDTKFGLTYTKKQYLLTYTKKQTTAHAIITYRGSDSLYVNQTAQRVESYVVSYIALETFDFYLG